MTKLTIYCAVLAFIAAPSVLCKIIDRSVLRPGASTVRRPNGKALSVSPQNDAVYEGMASVILACESTVAPPDSRIHWFEYTTGNQQLISDNYDITAGHPNAARYSIISNSPTEFYLEIRNVVLADGGTYECQDQNAGPPDAYRGQAELIVIQSTMNCTTLVHDNGIVMEDQNYTNECDVRYRGGFAPALSWSGPQPYRGPVEITTDTDVYSGIGYTVARSFDTRAYSVLSAFADLGDLPEGVASNTPSLTERYLFDQMYVYWGPKNLMADPIKPSYNVGDVVTCTADAFPAAFIQWQNMNTLEIIYSPQFTVTLAMEGFNTRMRCQAQNVIQGFLWSQNLFIDVPVPASTTTPTIPTTTTAPLDAPCNDLSGWWLSYSPYAELNLIVSNDGYGRVTGGLRNFTDQYTVEVAGRTRVSDYAYLGVSLIYPSNKGIVGLTGECHRCSGKEVLIVESIWRSITDSSECGDGGTPGPSTAYSFVRYDDGISPGSLKH